MTEEVYVGIEERFGVGVLFGQKVGLLRDHISYLSYVEYDQVACTISTGFVLRRNGYPRKEYIVIAPCPDPKRIAVHATVECWLNQAKELLK